MDDSTPRVTFTVKEMLEAMDRRADERHAEALRQIADVTANVRVVSSRVSALEADRQRKIGVVSAQGRIWVAAVAILGLVVNIPAAMFYLGGGHG